jgi:quercetin dioxygenase-like cupin family protein
MLEIIRFGAIELRFLCDKHSTNGSLDMFEMTLPSGNRMPVAHYHRDWDETIYGLTEVVTFTVEGQIHAVGPGETLFIPRGKVHAFDNTSGATATCLVTLTPGVLGPEYFREMAGLAMGGAPDPGKLREVMLRHGLVPG